MYAVINVKICFCSRYYNVRLFLLSIFFLFSMLAVHMPKVSSHRRSWKSRTRRKRERFLKSARIAIINYFFLAILLYCLFLLLFSLRFVIFSFFFLSSSLRWLHTRQITVELLLYNDATAYISPTRYFVVRGQWKTFFPIQLRANRKPFRGTKK